MSLLITEKLFILPIVHSLSPHISIRKMEELSILVIDHPMAQAAVALQGAHLLSWQPASEKKPVIWLSEKTAWVAGAAIRGGVPICWPWFASSDEINKPSHGFARNQQWILKHHSENQDNVNLTLTLTNNAETWRLWPHDFILHAHFNIGTQCTITLEAIGGYNCTAALHSYFMVDDIEHTVINGLGNSYIDKMQQGRIGEQKGDLCVIQQTDRIYTHPEACSHIIDHQMPRTITVQHHNNSDVVVWNPWERLSSNMIDMPDLGYQNMVCVETARISEEISVTAAKPERLGVTISGKR